MLTERTHCESRAISDSWLRNAMAKGVSKSRIAKLLELDSKLMNNHAQRPTRTTTDQLVVK